MHIAKNKKQKRPKSGHAKGDIKELQNIKETRERRSSPVKQLLVLRASINSIFGFFVRGNANSHMTLEEWEQMENKKVFKKNYENPNHNHEDLH